MSSLPTHKRDQTCRFKTLIIFQTNYDFAITQPGCGGSGMLYQTGGKNYELEEIYFNKITTVGAVHDEDTYKVVEEGCGKGGESTFTSEFDGFVIKLLFKTNNK